MKQSLFLFAWLTMAVPARAEIAVLANGGTLKVSTHRSEGELVYLSLAGGGEVATPLSAIRGFVPDEVADEIAAVAASVPAGTDVRTLAAEAARRYGLDPALVLAVVSAESGFETRAVSPKGAQGLMQLMPATAASLGIKDVFDPAANLDGGSRYLSSLVRQYNGDLTRAVAAYNAGPGAVQKHGGVPPYRETRAYVKRVLRGYARSAQPPATAPAQAATAAAP